MLYPGTTAGYTLLDQKHNENITGNVTKYNMTHPNVLTI
jgi:hypothetical protein